MDIVLPLPSKEMSAKKISAKEIPGKSGNSPSMGSVAELIQRLQAQDRSALEPLIAETQELGYRLAYSFVRDAHLAQDVLQDVYLVVYRDIHKLKNPAAFRTWFCRIVANRCRRYLRRAPHRPLEQAPEPRSTGMAERVDRRLLLEAALSGLKEIDREILCLREANQLSYEELAAVLEIPVGTVRSRLSKARQRLYLALTDLEKNDETS